MSCFTTPYVRCSNAIARTSLCTSRQQFSHTTLALALPHAHLLAKRSDESGKRHFAAGHLERALVDFSLALRHLERLEHRAARREGREPCFDAEATGFRNLDDYLDKCAVGIQRRQRRAAATVLDQRALLSSGGDVTQPSLAIRLQAGCLRCLASMAEVSEMIGRIKDNLMQATPPAPA